MVACLEQTQIQRYKQTYKVLKSNKHVPRVLSLQGEEAVSNVIKHLGERLKLVSLSHSLSSNGCVNFSFDLSIWQAHRQWREQIKQDKSFKKRELLGFGDNKNVYV